MAITPERIAELERLKALMRQPANDFQRRAQAVENAEKMGIPVTLPTDKKAKGGLEKFLKDSKVKERLYHGTDKSFSKFKPKKGMIFLAPKPDFANDYTTSNLDIVERRKLSPNVMPVHVHVKNPWDYEIPEHVDALHAGLVAHPDIGPEFATTKGRLSSGDWTAIEDPAIQETIRKLGHDAFYVNEGGYRNLGMYNPRNIKSATGNIGTYNRRTSDVTKANGGQISQDAMRLALMKPKHFAQGGSEPRNWAPGHDKRLQNALRNVMFREPALIKGVDTAGEMLEHIKKTTGPEHMDDQLAQEIQRLEKRHAINQWLERNFGNYVKKQMGTETDPVRLQAELNVRGFPVAADPSYWARKGETRRKISGGKQMGQSDVAKHWENKADAMIEAEKAQEHQDMMHLAPGMYSEKDEWIKKLDPNANLWSLTEHFDPRDLGMDHIRDVLHEDLVSGRIRPEQLNKISMAQAVKRAHEYDQEMEKRRQETAIQSTNDMPMVHEYPETGMKWIELAPSKEKKMYSAENLPEGFFLEKDRDGYYQVRNTNVGQAPTTDSFSRNPEEAITKFNKWVEQRGRDFDLEKALKYEGDTMGHCVGGHGYCEKVKKGQARIFSLRDAKGEPHVTIETSPEEQYNEAADILGIDDPTSEDVRSLRESGRLPKAQERIIQIKGKGNRKPAAKYIPHVQHFVKSGNWSHIGDYGNTDLIQVKKGQHATKEEVEALGRHHYPEHNMPAENVLMHYDRMRGMPEFQNDVTKNFIADMEAGNYHLPAPVVKKAIGGTVQPSLQQMRQALMAAGKPLQDISQIGAQEAPNLPVKTFVIPDNGAQGQLPVGGVDMSPQQPGQQFLPQSLMQPQQNPLAPQQAQPPAPAPQAGSNILQMTPQGQKMAALSGTPQGNQPPAPPAMAVGGSVPMPVNNHPFQTAGQKPLPFMAKVGGSDNRPMDNQSMDNGATTFNIDNIQELNEGGQPKPTKEQRKEIAKKWAGQLHYEPAPPMSKQDIESHADRMVAQILGIDNPHGKTKQQLEREKALIADIRYKKMKNIPDVDYSKLKNAWLVGIPGDPTIGGVIPVNKMKKRFSLQMPTAGATLRAIDKQPLETPVPLYGGTRYGAYGGPNGWASDLGASRGLFNVVQKLHEEDPSREIYGNTHRMSNESINHAIHMLDSAISHMRPHMQPKDRVDYLNNLIRNVRTSTNDIGDVKPHFVGFEDPNDLMLQASMDAKLRKKILGVLATNKHFPGGKQMIDDIYYAISHPELRNLEVGTAGHGVLKFDPNRKLENEISQHPTYAHDIPSELIGKSRYPIPLQIAAPRSMQRSLKKAKEMGLTLAQPFNDMSRSIIREPIDQQYINQLGEYELAMKKRLGYKKGGKVKLSTNMDTINLELSKSRKKAK